MRVHLVSRAALALALAVIFTLVPFTLVHAHIEGCACLGMCCCGSDAGTCTGCGGYSLAGGTIATHSGYGEYTGESHFAGFAFNANNTAQTIFAGTGLGRRGNSLELTLTMADVSEFSDFLVSAKYQFLRESPTRPAIAVGIDAINEIPGQMETSPYIVTSKYFPTGRLPVVASLGWGSGRFQDNFFGALAFILGRQWNFIVEYDGLGGNLGISFGSELSLWRPFPVVVTLAEQNAFASEEESVLSIGAGIRFH